MLVPNRSKTLFNFVALPAAGTYISDLFNVPFRTVCVSALGNFTYGAGGTTAKAYLQTTLDAGATWIDIASFAFALATAKLAASVHGATAGFTPVDGSLSDNTVKDGLMGDWLRAKLIIVGTYTTTSFALNVVLT